MMRQIDPVGYESEIDEWRYNLEQANDLLSQAIEALREIRQETRGHGVWWPFFAKINRIASRAIAACDALTKEEAE